MKKSGKIVKKRKGNDLDSVSLPVQVLHVEEGKVEREVEIIEVIKSDVSLKTETNVPLPQQKKSLVASDDVTITGVENIKEKEEKNKRVVTKRNQGKHSYN